MTEVSKNKLRWTMGLKGGVKLGVSVLCLAFFAGRLDSASILQSVSKVNKLLFALSVAGFIILSVLQTWRWKIILKCIKINYVSFRSAQESVLIGMFFNQGLPSSLGGDAIRVWRLSHSKTSFQKILSSIVIERIAAVLGMVLITSVLIPYQIDLITDSRVYLSIMVINISAVTCILLILSLNKFSYVTLLEKFALIRFIKNISMEIKLVTKSQLSIVIMLITLVIHFSVSLLFWLLALSLGVDISPVICITLVPVVLLVTTLPISIAGWGVRESIVVLLFGFVNVHPAQAFSISILFGLAVAVAALPGIAVWLATNKHKNIDPSEL